MAVLSMLTPSELDGIRSANDGYHLLLAAVIRQAMADGLNLTRKKTLLVSADYYMAATAVPWLESFLPNWQQAAQHLVK